MVDGIKKYKKTTDVQRTWREAGWAPPSEDPEMRAKWLFYKTLDTEQANLPITQEGKDE